MACECERLSDWDMTSEQALEVAQMVTGIPKERFEADEAMFHEFLNDLESKWKKKDKDMPIVVKDRGESNFEVPSEGEHNFVLMQVKDQGEKDTAWGKKPKVLLVFQLEEKDSNGRRKRAFKSYTASLNEKANLRKDLEVWRGAKFTRAELDGFDLERLVGVNGRCVIAHNPGNDGGIFANVQVILPPAKGQALLEIETDEDFNYGANKS